MISREQIQTLARHFAIDQFTIIREYFQILLLSLLYKEKKSDQLFFKGGTAIRLLFPSFRFSEDLDFTSTLSQEEVKTLLAKALRGAETTDPGISLKKIQTGRFGLTGTIRYLGPDQKHPLHIHLEVSLRENPYTHKDTVLESLFPVSPNPIVRHMDWNEILAEKIRALMIRGKGRDIFDVWFLMSKGVLPDWKLINIKMKLYQKEITVQNVLDRIEQMGQKQLSLDLGQFLPSTHRKMTGTLCGNLAEKFRGFRSSK